MLSPSKEEKEFIIDASSENLKIDATANSDSESDYEIPQFKISAFDKYTSKEFKTDNGKFDNSATSAHAGLANLSFKCALDKDKIKELENASKQYQKSIREGLPKISRRRARKLKLKEKVGHKWYNVPAPEMTEERKNDLKVLQMRQALDPKHFYKRSAAKANPRYFEVGTYVDSPLEYYSRIPKKQRKRTLVEELMADTNFTSKIKGVPGKNKTRKAKVTR